MKEIQLTVDNIKCGGCAHTVKTNLSKVDGVENVSIGIEEGEIRITGDELLEEEDLYQRLATLGYPKKGKGTTFQKAKSYVSCAIGKMSAE